MEAVALLNAGEDHRRMNALPRRCQMIMRATALARGLPVKSGRAVVLWGSALALAAVLAGCANSDKQPDGPAAGGSATATSDATPSDSTPAGSTPSPSTSPSTSPGNGAGSSDAPCEQWSCVPDQPVQLGDGYSVRLWTSAAPSAAVSPDRSTPVLQLLRDGQHLQWWVGRSGFGWTTKLDCLPAGAGRSAHCAVLAAAGSHAGIAEVVLLRSGALVSPAPASVTFDGGRPVAADLDQDGWLDVLGTENDYQPNYATGRNYWATYRLADGSLHRTGCVPRRTTAEPPPDRLLTGACPVRFPT
jgi:hypothetical protein